MGNLLDVVGLKVSVAGKVVVDNISLSVGKGEVVAVIGPNGSGKSSLAYSIMGRPGYVVESGSILFDGRSILSYSPDERAKAGIFLSFQSPVEVEGVAVETFLRSAFNSIKGGNIGVLEFHRILEGRMAKLGIGGDFLSRSLNLGFSGGEKKRMEVLQMLALQPKLALLDEVDSGLDADAFKAVASCVRDFADAGSSVLVISHHMNIFDYVSPDKVYVLSNGRVVSCGGSEILEMVEKNGYVGIGNG